MAHPGSHLDFVAQTLFLSLHRSMKDLVSFHACLCSYWVILETRAFCSPLALEILKECLHLCQENVVNKIQSFNKSPALLPSPETICPEPRASILVHWAFEGGCHPEDYEVYKPLMEGTNPSLCILFIMKIIANIYIRHTRVACYSI